MSRPLLHLDDAGPEAELELTTKWDGSLTAKAVVGCPKCAASIEVADGDCASAHLTAEQCRVLAAFLLRLAEGK